MKRASFFVTMFLAIASAVFSVSVSAESWIETEISGFKGVIAPAVSIDSLPYKNVDTEVAPSLLVMGNMGDLFFEGNRLGYVLNRSDFGALSIVGQLRTHQYIPDDSEFGERDKAVEVGIQLAKPINNDWTAQVTLFTDVSDTHLGQEVELGIYRRFVWDDFRLLTLFALQQQSDKLTDYYAGYDEYEADGDLNAEIELIGVYELNDNWNLTMVYRHYFHGDELADSPIVDDDQTQKLLLGVGYSF